MVDWRPVSIPGQGRQKPTRLEFTLSANAAGAIGAPSTQGPVRFHSTDHLSAEAVVAYIDSALTAAAAARASFHLERCAECRHEVQLQRDARAVLRQSGPIRMPDDLRDRLRGLPDGPPPSSVFAEVPDDTISARLRRLFGRRLRR